MFRRALPLLRLLSPPSATRLSPLQQRCFTAILSTMSDLTIDLTAPNGKKFTLPTGIFVNNEFVKSKSGKKITSINPTSVYAHHAASKPANVDDDTGMRRKYAASMQPAPRTSTSPSKQPVKRSTTLPGEISRPPTAAPSCSSLPT